MQNLNNLLKLLLENKIDFVLIGGFAGVVHGSSLVTKDLDICAVLTSEQVSRLRDVLKNYHPKHRMTPLKLSFLIHPESTVGLNNIYLETDLGVLDIISQVTGVGDFKRVTANAVTVPLYGHVCKVISIDDLIDAKKAMGREKDLLATKELQAIKTKRGKP